MEQNKKPLSFFENRKELIGLESYRKIIGCEDSRQLFRFADEMRNMQFVLQMKLVFKLSFSRRNFFDMYSGDGLKLPHQVLASLKKEQCSDTEMVDAQW